MSNSWFEQGLLVTEPLVPAASSAIERLEQMTNFLRPADNHVVGCGQAFRHEEACYERPTERLEELD